MTDDAAGNLGGSSGFYPSNNDGPAPREKAREKRSDAPSVTQDDSARWVLWKKPGHWPQRTDQKSHLSGPPSGLSGKTLNPAKDRWSF